MHSILPLLKISSHYFFPYSQFSSSLLSLPAIFSNLFSAFLQSSPPIQQFSQSLLCSSLPYNPSIISCFVGVIFSVQGKKKMAKQLCNPRHLEHELELKKYLKPYTCDGCKELGFGPRYRCKKCNFDLHKACMFSHKAPNSHEFFPGSTFEFLRNPPEPCHEECRIKCDACTRTINGFVFHCDKPDLDLHPCCLNLKKSYQIEDVEFNLHKKVKGKCMWCKRKSLKDGGWSYISECGEYHVHVACVTEMALEEWYKNGGNIAEHEQSLALKMNLNQIQARGHGNGRRGNKFWRILKIFIQTIVSIVLGDPTMILTSFFVQLIA